MAIHNEAKLGEIAKNVLMPGDPMRAKYIAENFLEEYKLVNSVRGIYAYTGKYKGKEITVMASGMGMPSIGIYSYELYKFYGVENIIRIGSCGAYTDYLNLLDIVLVDKSYTAGNFAKNMTGEECHMIDSSNKLNNIIEDVVNFFEKNDVELLYGKIICVSEDNKKTEDQRAPLENIWYQMPLAHPSVFVKKSVYAKFGAFNVNYRVTSDYELMLRLYVKNTKFKFIDKVCAYFRLGGLSSTHVKERQE